MLPGVVYALGQAHLSIVPEHPATNVAPPPHIWVFLPRVMSPVFWWAFELGIGKEPHWQAPVAQVYTSAYTPFDGKGAMHSHGGGIHKRN